MKTHLFRISLATCLLLLFSCSQDDSEFIPGKAPYFLEGHINDVPYKVEQYQTHLLSRLGKTFSKHEVWNQSSIEMSECVQLRMILTDDISINLYLNNYLNQEDISIRSHEMDWNKPSINVRIVSPESIINEYIPAQNEPSCFVRIKNIEFDKNNRAVLTGEINGRLYHSKNPKDYIDLKNCIFHF